MKLSKEDRYIRRRLRQGRKQAREFYYCRKYPIDPKKIVFTTIEGTTGFSCNPKYIALELLRRRQDLDLVWLVDDMSKEFSAGIRKVKNTLKNRAYELSTAAVWVDNSRKQLECRKRPGQFYLQTWHASIAIKPIGLERGASFSKIARMVTEHDSRMIDLFVTNSAWVEEHAALGMLYHGEMIRTGSARVDALINDRDNIRRKFREKYGLAKDTKIAMYAPTFRSGSQGTERDPAMQNKMPDFRMLKEALEKRFGVNWVIVLRLHPQLTARHISLGLTDKTGTIIDASREEDMCETLGAADFLLTDYSALAFDAAFMNLPVFLYVYDLKEYIKERGQLSWNLEGLPFPYAENMDELCRRMNSFELEGYKKALQKLWKITELKEDGQASKQIVDIIEETLKG
ncbi:CDP-glycerol glycerophosphotransferase family protein [Selenomonas sp. ND2010]|uniref:CDP-glycerol glycerophosphotransferase family protein n=1 Tax=Selenomonas sp. ND2010 TaxID=1410618 RepID=UPI00051B5057|nr:CDP-glycerol glycerophosphotransferase family protein [Selenomonas sp. ND2010]